MKILIVSLDNSDEIVVGGKHIHQQFLEQGLKELNQDNVEKVFPRRTKTFLVVRVILAILVKLGIISRAYVFEWTIKRHLNDLKKQLRKKREVDVVYAQDPISAVASIDVLKSSKTIQTLHGYLSLESVNYVSFKEHEKKRVIDFCLEFEKKAAIESYKVIAVDTKIANYVAEKFNRKDLIILKNAIDPFKFNKTTNDEERELRNELGIQNRKVILVPRRLVKKNGVHVAIQAISKVKSEIGPVYSLLVMGDGPLMGELKSLSKNLSLDSKDVIFLGSVEYAKVPKFYDISEIVLVPSVISDGVEEATSLSMLEGMAAKKIVIVSNIGGMKEVIRNNENGYLFNQGNWQELSDLIVGFKDKALDDFSDITECAYRDVCDGHHYINHSKKYLESIER